MTAMRTAQLEKVPFLIFFCTRIGKQLTSKSHTWGSIVVSQNIYFASFDRIQYRYCGQSKGNGSTTVLELKHPVCVYIKVTDFSSHISNNNPFVLHYIANKQQTFDAD